MVYSAEQSYGQFELCPIQANKPEQLLLQSGVGYQPKAFAIFLVHWKDSRVLLVKRFGLCQSQLVADTLQDDAWRGGHHGGYHGRFQIIGDFY